MRKCNAILTIFILVLFLLHAVLGSFQMIGIGNTVLKSVSWITFGFIVAHTMIGIRLTWDTLKVRKKTGVSYFRENKLFWARRISGFSIMLLLAFHLTAFGHTRDGAYRLYWFTVWKLAAQILLAVAIAVHIITNIRPMMISLGIKSMKQWINDIFIVLSVLILFMVIAFVIYYLRWNVA